MTSRPPSSSSSSSRPVRATYAYSSLGMLGREKKRTPSSASTSASTSSSAAALRSPPPGDRITRHASPSRATLEWQSESIVSRVPQPYRTSFSAVTSPRRIRAPSESPPVPRARPSGYMLTRGEPTRVTMPGRIRPVLPAAGKHKSNDELASPVREIESVAEKHKSNDDLLSPKTDHPPKLPGKKSDVRFLSTPTKLHTIETVIGRMPPKSNGVDSSNDMLDTTFDSVLTDGSLDARVSDFMTPAVTDRNQIQPVDSQSKPVDSGFVEGRVEKKTLIQKEYVHVQTVNVGKLGKLRQGLPRANEHTEQIVKDLKKKRIFGRSKSADKNGQSLPTSPEYVHKDKQGRSSTLPSETLLESQKEPVSVRKSLSSSITKIFRRMSPKSLRKMSPKSARKASSTKSTPDGSNSSLFGNEICDINIDSSSIENSDQSGVHKQKVGLDSTLINGAVLVPADVTDTVTPDSEHHSRSPIPANSARLLKSIENNAASLKNADRYKTSRFVTSSASALATKDGQKTPVNTPSPKAIEAISMKPQALRAVEFPDGTSSTESQNKQQQQRQQRFIHPRQLSADQVESVEPVMDSLRGRCSGQLDPDRSRFRSSVEDNLSDNKLDMGSGPGSGGGPKKFKPPSTLNIRQVAQLSRSTLQYPSMSTESIGGCSLDVYNTGSEPSLSSRNGVSGGKSINASKHTLRSEDTVDSSLSPSPAAATHTHSTAHQEDITRSPALNSSTGATTSNSSPKTPSYLKLSCTLGGYKNYGGSPGQQKKIIVIKRRTSENGDCEDELDNGHVNKIVQNGGAAEIISSPLSSLEQQQQQQSSPVPQSSPTHREIPITIHRTSSKDDGNSNGNANANDESGFGSRVSVPLSPTVITSSSPVANGDVVSAQNGHDEVDFSLARIGQKRLEKKLSREELDTPTPSKDGAYFLAVCDGEEVRLQQQCDEAERYMRTDAAALSEEASGRIRAAIGKANLLTKRKFQQFRGLCTQNMEQDAGEPFHTTAQDLAGFWDMVLLQVTDIDLMFTELRTLRANGWRTPEKNTPVSESRPTPRAPSSASGATPASRRGPKSAAGPTPKSAKAQEAARHREMARRKLMEAKRQGRQRKLSNEDSNDVVEIFVA